MDWVTRYRVPAESGGDLPRTAEEAVRHLAEGNARFAEDAADFHGLPVGTGQPPRQAPFGVVLGCSDARAPLELVFDARPNQLFVVRVAGNVLGDESLGSIEYALANFRDSLRLLTVLGHTGCGAVAAAVGTYLSPKHHAGIAFSRSLRAVVNHILVAVRSAALSLEQVRGPGVAADPGYPAALAEATVFLNTAMTAYQLRQELRPDDVGVKVVYGVYDLTDCKVGGAGDHPQGPAVLSAAPASPQELVNLGLALAAAPRVARHLGKPAV
jgi:carbonic anhydrase